jgi:hypothetical protein
VEVFLRALARAALRRGLAGNVTWLVIALCTIILRRALTDRGGVVTSLRVSPGERLLISVTDPRAQRAPAAALADAITLDEP